MSRYNIPLRVKISEREYDKIKNMKNKSAFVREAINSYHGNNELEIESSKKEMLEKITEDVRAEQKRYNEKLLRQQKRQEKKMLDKLKRMNDACEDRLKILKEENKAIKLPSYDSIISKRKEEKILAILPRLQGIYHSEKGVDYDILKIQAFKIGVDTMELKEWMDNNRELLENPDPSNRDFNFASSLKEYQGF